MAENVDADMRSKWIIIGISGVTCGGKTTLAGRLLARLRPAHVFHQDKYFYPDDSTRHVRCRDMQHNNYDVLSALDMRRLHRDVLETLAGRGAAHGSHTVPDARCEGLPGKQFLIVEGFTVLNYKPINELCDLRYYLVLEYGTCASRRALRLYDPPDVDGYFDKCVWPEHLRYRAEIEADKRVRLLDGTSPDVFDVVMDDIRALGASGSP